MRCLSIISLTFVSLSLCFSYKSLTRRSHHRKFSVVQMMTEENYPQSRRDLISSYVSAFGILPVVSYLSIPYCLHQITDFDLSTDKRQFFIIVLLLSKRLILYANAILTVDISAKRSFEMTGGLGQRLMTVNDEMFMGLPVMGGEANRQKAILQLKEEIEENTGKLDRSTIDNETLSALYKEEATLLQKVAKIEDSSRANKAAYEALDSVGAKELSVSLPLLLVASLAASFLLLSTPQPPASTGLQMDQTSLLQAFRSLASGSAALVCFFFSKAQVQSVLKTFSVSSTFASVTIPLLLVFFSYVHLPFADVSWVAQNAVNLCIAVTVARVLQVTELKWIIATLIGVAAYDFAAVVGTQQLTDGGASIMEAVARSRADLPGPGTDSGAAMALDALGLNKWQPGLFQTAVGGRTSDLLGLGDAVFPSMLAGWALREDKQGSSGSVGQYFKTCMAAYALGCVLCDVFQTGSGQPALVFIVPSMFVGLLLLYAKERVER